MLFLRHMMCIFENNFQKHVMCHQEGFCPFTDLRV